MPYPRGGVRCAPDFAHFRDLPPLPLHPPLDLCFFYGSVHDPHMPHFIVSGVALTYSKKTCHCVAFDQGNIQ